MRSEASTNTWGKGRACGGWSEADNFGYAQAGARDDPQAVARIAKSRFHV